MASLVAALAAGVMVANLGELLPGVGVATTDVSASAAPTATFGSFPAAVPPPVARPRRTPTDFHAGMTVVVYGNDSQLDAKTEALLDRLVGLEVNALSLTFPVYMPRWNSSVIDASPELTPTDENLSRFVRLARERSFTVMLRPILDEKNLIADGQWRGSIRPSNVRAWFQSYGDLMLRYAALAQRERVAAICLGTELVSLEPQAQEWSALIAKVRAVFDGQLTYCANWDSFSRVPFWDDLDFIGVDGFFPLNASAQADVAELTAAWQTWVRRLTDFQQASGKPLVLTEQGVTSQSGSHRQPWLWDQRTPIDLEGQARYYQASCAAWKQTVSGIYWWSVDLGLPANPGTDIGFNPLGKPAESEVRTCFAR